MSDWADIQLGPLTLSVRWPMTITPPKRQVTTMANALSTHPVQVTDYIADYGTVAFEAKLEGTETQHETAGDCLERLDANLRQVIANAGGSEPVVLSVQLRDAGAPVSYTLYKSDPPARTEDWVTDKHHLRFVTCTVRYL